MPNREYFEAWQVLDRIVSMVNNLNQKDTKNILSVKVRDKNAPETKIRHQIRT